MRTAFSKAEIESEIAGRFSDAFKLHEKPTVASVMSTGIPEVDSLTGGLPRGAITEIFGLPSSGRTSFLLSTLAYATRHDEVCALVDTSDAFDPVSAAAAGVDLDRLLWVRCAAKMEHAFKAADMLLQGGGFGLVGLDISDVPSPDARRIISSWWYRFRRTVEKTPTSFIVIAADSCVRSCASLALQMKHDAEGWYSISHTSDSNRSKHLSLVTPRSVSGATTIGSVPGAVATESVPGAVATGSLNTPSHSNLMGSLHFQVVCQKPMILNDNCIGFRSHMPL
jgi:RecA DNA recombination protein